MTTSLKFDSKVGSAAANALEPHIRPLYDRPGASILAICEFRHVERTQPAPDADKDPSVKVRMTSIEIPNKDQEGAIREAARALFVHRTAAGTLDDDGIFQLSDASLKNIGGLLHGIEAARLRAGLDYWVRYIARVNADPNLTISEIKHELDGIARGMAALLNAAEEDR